MQYEVTQGQNIGTLVVAIKFVSTIVVGDAAKDRRYVVCEAVDGKPLHGRTQDGEIVPVVRAKFPSHWLKPVVTFIPDNDPSQFILAA